MRCAFVPTLPGTATSTSLAILSAAVADPALSHYHDVLCDLSRYLCRGNYISRPPDGLDTIFPFRDAIPEARIGEARTPGETGNNLSGRTNTPGAALYLMMTTEARQEVKATLCEIVVAMTRHPKYRKQIPTLAIVHGLDPWAPATAVASAIPFRQRDTEGSPKPATEESSPPGSAIPDFQNAQEYIDRLPALTGLSERNVEDAVKELLLHLGHEREKIIFQLGRIDVAVQDRTGRTALVIEVKRSLGSAPQRADALRKGFDYAAQNGARYVVVTDADRFEVYDRTRGLDHTSMLCAKFRLTSFRESDAAGLDLLRPQTSD